MSSVIGALTGSGGAGYEAKNNPVTRFVSKEQTDQAYKNTQDALAQQLQFAQALQGQNGIGNQSNVFNQLGDVAKGQGPNPAQAMLTNATGQNIANQTAMMAGQRGSSSNPALLARQAAMQGANTQQQAAGQAAGLQAQQSLGALNQMGGIAGQQVGQQGNAVNAYNQSALQGQGNLLNAGSAQNNALVANEASNTKANSEMQQMIAEAQMNMVNNLVGGGAKAAAVGSGSPAAMAGTGTTPKAEGGLVGPKSHIGQYHAAMANGGPVPAIVSPGEKYLNPQDVQMVRHGANPLAMGETIPGQPKVGGAKDSYANDTVPKTLQEGGIVLPRSVTQAKDAPQKAAEFVAAILKQQALKKG